MNAALGNVGKTVFYSDPLEVNSVDQRQSLQELLSDIDAGRVELLVMLGGNPVYNTPADLKLNAERMFKVKTRVHLGLYRDETSELCHWHVPETHFLEAWGDTRAYDGTVTIVQPLIEPLYQSRSAHEVLAVFSPQYDQKPYDIIRAYWQAATGNTRTVAASSPSPSTNPASRASPAATPAAPPAGTPSAPATKTGDFDSSWRKWIHDGFVPNTALPVKTVSAGSGSAISSASGTSAVSTTTPSGSFEVVFRADPTIYDGRFANNGWLQELPKPLNKVTWDNVALVSPNTARQLGLHKEIGRKGGDVYVDTLKLTHQGRTIGEAVPTWITPGQPDNVITIHLG
jgi:molybdopterin-containing oxidoreductase family iron-sulfur binding subunit